MTTEKPETIFDWAERMLASPKWEEHESAAWVTNMGGSRADDPCLEFEFSMSVKRAPPPLSMTDPVTIPEWWKWTVRSMLGAERYKVSGHTTTMDLGKTVCTCAMRRLITGFRITVAEELGRTQHLQLSRIDDGPEGVWDIMDGNNSRHLLVIRCPQRGSFTPEVVRALAKRELGLDPSTRLTGGLIVAPVVEFRFGPSSSLWRKTGTSEWEKTLDASEFLDLMEK